MEPSNSSSTISSTNEASAEVSAARDQPRAGQSWLRAAFQGGAPSSHCAQEGRPWQFLTLLAFRLTALYFTLYVLVTQMLGGLLPLPIGSLPDIGQLMNPLIAWTGDHVFHVTAKPVMSGSGDKLYDWVQAFCLLGIAIMSVAIWSIVDRKRESHDRVYRWFRVFLRFALGSTMIGYGFMKAFPLQMPAPQLTRLLEPFGNFSPMGVLWYSIGSAFPYERFVGLVEVTGGALLFFPRTQLAGALVCLGATIEIFALNMTYDVPVKLFSFHLILMSCFLIAPHAAELVSTCLGGSARSRWAAIAQAAFGLYLLGMELYGTSNSWKEYGPNAPKPPLYGIWTIDTMWIDGIERLPLITDYDRWRRVIVNDANAVVFWRMDDSAMSIGSKVDNDAKTIALSRGNDPAGVLKFDQPVASELTLEGTIDKHNLRMKAHSVDHTRFPLLTRGFHWIQEVPFNR